MNISDKVKNRQKDNRKIIKLISEYVERFPEIRFHQALLNLNIIIQGEDLYYEEPADTLKRIKK